MSVLGHTSIWPILFCFSTCMLDNVIQYLNSLCLKKKFFLSLFQSFHSLTNTWASLFPLFILVLLSPSCLLTLWSSFFLTKQMTRKKPWPPLDFSVPPWRLISLFHFDWHVHLKQAYCIKQGLGESTKGSVWSLLPSSLLPSHLPAPFMASWISQSASACSLIC